MKARIFDEQLIGWLVWRALPLVIALVITLVVSLSHVFPLWGTFLFGLVLGFLAAKIGDLR